MTDVDQSDRRGRLRSIKLQALVRDHLGRELDARPGSFPPGAALSDDAQAWVLVEDVPERGLGAALAWAVRNGAGELHVLADRATGLLARRATGFRLPITVWHVAERTLLPAVAEPPLVPPPADPAHLELVDTIVAGGAVPVVEHGVVTGEVRGLEVCRVVDDPSTGAVRLEVGVGAHDREAFTIIHGDVPTVEALAGVVHAVIAHRSTDAPLHPLNHLAPERLLRWRLEQDPALLDLVTLTPSQPPVPRPNVKDRVPCTAIGRREDGSGVLVVCSVGVDLDLVPYAVDARLTTLSEDGGPGAVGETWLVTPPRDLVPVTAEIAALADQALSLVPFSG
ncbi:MAG: hypothetical protein ABW219_00365 [Ilumatobacteraceae bacterium]